MLGNWIHLIIILYLAVNFVGKVRKRPFLILINTFSFALFLVLAFSAHSHSIDFFTSNFAIAKVYASVLGFFIDVFIFGVIIIFLTYKISPKLASTKNSLVSKIVGELISSAYGASVVFVLFWLNSF